MATGNEKDRNVAHDSKTKGHQTEKATQDSKKQKSEPISEHKPVDKTKHPEPAKSK